MLFNRLIICQVKIGRPHFGCYPWFVKPRSNCIADNEEKEGSPLIREQLHGLGTRAYYQTKGGQKVTTHHSCHYGDSVSNCVNHYIFLKFPSDASRSENVLEAILIIATLLTTIVIFWKVLLFAKHCARHFSWIFLP